MNNSYLPASQNEITQLQQALSLCQQEKTDLAHQLQQMQQQLSHTLEQQQKLEAEWHREQSQFSSIINRLHQRLEQVKQDYFDLELLLRTTTEHADALEDALSHKVDIIASEKSDLEIILQTITEHADTMTGELLDKAENHAQQTLKQEFLNEIKSLRRRVEELKREKFDLRLLLETTTAHADALEDVLRHRGQRGESDQKKNSLNESLVSNSVLAENKSQEIKELCEMVEQLKYNLIQAQQEKLDLELLLQTSTEHADVLEDALRQRAEEVLQEKSDLEILLENTTEHSTLVENALQDQAEAAARESERRLAQFLEAVPVGVLVLDASSKPYYANQMAQKIFGIENLLQQMEFFQFDDARQLAQQLLENLPPQKLVVRLATRIVPSRLEFLNNFKPIWQVLLFCTPMNANPLFGRCAENLPVSMIWNYGNMGKIFRLKYGQHRFLANGAKCCMRLLCFRILPTVSRQKPNAFV